jgi:hypothetical protein
MWVASPGSDFSEEPAFGVELVTQEYESSPGVLPDSP